jgi:ribosomal protein L19E
VKLFIWSILALRRSLQHLRRKRIATSPALRSLFYMGKGTQRAGAATFPDPQAGYLTRQSLNT